MVVGQIDKLNGKLFNIGSEEEITVIDAAERVLKHFPNSPSKIKHITTEEVFGKYNEISRRRPDLSQSKKLLGYAPRLNFNDGLAIMVQHLKDNKLGSEQ